MTTVERQVKFFPLAMFMTSTSGSWCSVERAGGGVVVNRAYMAARTMCPTVFHVYWTELCYITLNSTHCTFTLPLTLYQLIQPALRIRIMVDVRGLTGFGPGGGGVALTGGAEPSADSSSCLLMSSVVNRLDSSPKMWMIANLLEGLGWGKITETQRSL